MDEMELGGENMLCDDRGLTFIELKKGKLLVDREAEVGPWRPSYCTKYPGYMSSWGCISPLNCGPKPFLHSSACWLRSLSPFGPAILNQTWGWRARSRQTPQIGLAKPCSRKALAISPPTHKCTHSPPQSVPSRPHPSPLPRAPSCQNPVPTQRPRPVQAFESGL